MEAEASREDRKGGHETGEAVRRWEGERQGDERTPQGKPEQEERQHMPEAGPGRRKTIRGNGPPDKYTGRERAPAKSKIRRRTRTEGPGTGRERKKEGRKAKREMAEPAHIQEPMIDRKPAQEEVTDRRDQRVGPGSPGRSPDDRKAPETQNRTRSPGPIPQRGSESQMEPRKKEKRKAERIRKGDGERNRLHLARGGYPQA